MDICPPHRSSLGIGCRGSLVRCLIYYHTTLVLFSATPFFKQHPCSYLPPLLLWLFLKIFNHLCHSLFAIYIKIKKSDELCAILQVTLYWIRVPSYPRKRLLFATKGRLALFWRVVQYTQTESNMYFAKETFSFSVRLLGYSKQKTSPKKAVSPCAECVTFSLPRIKLKLSSGVFEWRAATGTKISSLFICLDPTTFELISVITLIGTICLKICPRTTAPLMSFYRSDTSTKKQTHSSTVSAIGCCEHERTNYSPLRTRHTTFLSSIFSGY